MENLKKEKKKRFTIYKLFKKSRKLIEEVQLVNRATFFFFFQSHLYLQAEQARVHSVL